jgi:hypothetical protein
MRSTNIGKIQYYPCVSQVPAETSARSATPVINSLSASHRWLFYHAECKKLILDDDDDNGE